MKELLALWPYVKRYRRLYLLGILCVLFTNVGLFIPRILGRVVDHLEHSPEPSPRFLAACALGIAAIALVRAVFSYFTRMTIGPASRHVEYDLRNDLYAKLSRLPMTYYSSMYTGDIMSRCTSDIEALRRVVMPGIMMPTQVVVAFTGALIMMLQINVKMTLIVLGPLVMLSATVALLGPLMHRLSRDVMEQLGSLSTRAQEDFSGISVIKAFAREESESAAFDVLSRDYLERNMKLAKLNGILHPLLMTIITITILITVFFGGRAIINNEMELSGFVEFLGLLMMVGWPMIAIGWVITLWQRGRASMVRVNEILNAPVEIADGPGTRHAIQRVTGDIEFRDLTFSYNSHPVLRSVSLRIDAGKTVALVGPVGCGKTTLVNLVCRLFSAPPGTLFMDGVPIHEIPLAVLRRSIGYVSQEPLLFSDTLFNNIAFGKENATEAEVAKAAETACIHGEIAGGYETMIGERGITLSGGQKQRVAIARALLTDPAILILDDALSSVDTHTEGRLLDNLRSFFRGRTTFIISHRISTVMGADQIIVLDEGSVVEKGVHSELIHAGGPYEKLYRKQLIESELMEE